MNEQKDYDRYSYPYDGRSANSDPGLIANLLSLVNLSEYGPGLNGPLDRLTSWNAQNLPWSPITWLLKILFGNRPSKPLE